MRAQKKIPVSEKNKRHALGEEKKVRVSKRQTNVARAGFFWLAFRFTIPVKCLALSGDH